MFCKILVKSSEFGDKAGDTLMAELITILGENGVFPFRSIVLPKTPLMFKFEGKDSNFFVLDIEVNPFND